MQRWLAEAGTPVPSRTRVNADHVRFAAANGSPAEFASIDAPALENFDIVIARDDALRELGVDERAVIAHAIRQQGLGRHVFGEPGSDTVVGGALRPDLSRGKPAPATVDETYFTPWEIRPIGGKHDPDENRMARLRLRDGTELAEPITVVPAEIVAPSTSRWLVRDTRDRTLGTAVPHGRGWIALFVASVGWLWLDQLRGRQNLSE